MVMYGMYDGVLTTSRQTVSYYRPASVLGSDWFVTRALCRTLFYQVLVLTREPSNSVHSTL